MSTTTTTVPAAARTTMASAPAPADPACPELTHPDPTLFMVLTLATEPCFGPQTRGE